MTTHYLHLHPEPFAKVQNGSKTIESRLFDEKRQSMKVEDHIVFTNRADEQKIEVKVVRILHAATFKDLFAMSDYHHFGADSLDQLLKNVAPYYSDIDQRRYGVIGIVFEEI